jgi:hypothetical protein
VFRMSAMCQQQTLGNGLASRYGACPDRSNLWAQGSRAEAASNKLIVGINVC